MSDFAVFRRIWLLIPVLLAIAATRSLGETPPPAVPPLATLPPVPAAVASAPTNAGAKIEEGEKFDKKSMPSSLLSLTAKPPAPLTPAPPLGLPPVAAASAPAASPAPLVALPVPTALPKPTALPPIPAPAAPATPPPASSAAKEPTTPAPTSLATATPAAPASPETPEPTPAAPVTKLEPIALPKLSTASVEAKTDSSKQIEEVVAAAKKEMAETAALAKRTISDAALLLKKAGTPAEDPKTRTVASAPATAGKAGLPPIAVTPSTYAPGSEIAIVLSQDRFYPAEIRVRSGMASTLVFSSVNRRPAALVIEPVQSLRQPDSQSPVSAATSAEVPAEITRELGNDRVTAISFDLAKGKYNFHDALGAARGTIIVE